MERSFMAKIPEQGGETGRDRNDISPCGNSAVTRREFLKATVVSGWAISVGAGAWADEVKSEMPYRTLGRTGEKVSAIGLGGFHIGQPKEEEGIRIIRTAIDRGINFMDNSWDYHDGGSEIRMGK